jgi:hypothetical protein
VIEHTLKVFEMTDALRLILLLLQLVLNCVKVTSVTEKAFCIIHQDIIYVSITRCSHGIVLDMGHFESVISSLIIIIVLRLMLSSVHIYCGHTSTKTIARRLAM